MWLLTATHSALTLLHAPCSTCWAWHACCAQRFQLDPFHGSGSFALQKRCLSRTEGRTTHDTVDASQRAVELKCQ